MACIYSDTGGKCTLYCPESNKGDTYKNSEYGFSADDDAVGFCAVEDDPEPSRNCSMFEDINGPDADEDF